jgi:hypothetical protein
MGQVEKGKGKKMLHITFVRDGKVLIANYNEDDARWYVRIIMEEGTMIWTVEMTPQQFGATMALATAFEFRDPVLEAGLCEIVASVFVGYEDFKLW